MTSLAAPYTVAPSFRSPHVGIRLLASAGWLVIAVLAVLGTAVWVGEGLKPLPVSFGSGPVNVIAVDVIALTTGSVGAVLAWRHPRNAIGWLLLVEGLATGSLTPVNLLVGQASDVVRMWPQSTIAAAWVMSVFLTPGTAAIGIFVFLLFPDGCFCSRRWWIAGVTTIVGAGLLSLASALDPSGMVWYPVLPNPTAVPYVHSAHVDAIRTAGVFFTLAALVLAGASVIARYRRADARGRLQLRWVVVGVAVMGATFIPFLVGRYMIDVSHATSDVLLAIMALGATAFPLTIAVAIVREHLYEIDDIIWHTLVYIPLMGLLAGLYAASVALFQRLFISLTGNGSDASIVLSSLLLASVFTPARQAIEGHVTRRFKPVPPADRHRQLGEPMAAPSSAPLVVTTGRVLADEAALAAARAEVEAMEARLEALERMVERQPEAARSERPRSRRGAGRAPLSPRDPDRLNVESMMDPLPSRIALPRRGGRTGQTIAGRA